MKNKNTAGNIGLRTLIRHDMTFTHFDGLRHLLGFSFRAIVTISY
jgi:hypothetical protein